MVKNLIIAILATYIYFIDFCIIPSWWVPLVAFAYFFTCTICVDEFFKGVRRNKLRKQRLERRRIERMKEKER